MPFHPLLEGAIDLHMHSGPSIFPRRQTDWELVEDAKRAGMGGLVIKSHEAPTADRTTLIRLKEPQMHVYGGIVCNTFVGGFCPQAVDVAIRSGGKIVWMPTISAREHQAHFARRNTRFFQAGKPLVHAGEGLTIFDRDGAILPEVREIVALVAEADVVLATGHLAPDEVLALASEARNQGVRKLLIQHTDLGIARIRFELERELAGKGAVLEKCYLACSRDFADITVEEMADSIRRLGARSCVLVTDYGQLHNMPAAEAFSEFVGRLSACGVNDDDIRTMIVDMPRELLGV
ncbi:DUF6282 family protein [Paenibacillus cymbidii]|uniref:DUF6282 family protein n=1 Tax=Paenibacillus cymbidii TaxID=1639034 RepID=UPI0010822150|nr:DUF6282 family protein [Paenibacillus cymbidii]